MPSIRRRRRRTVRFRPLVDFHIGGPAHLERRVLLSGLPAGPHAAHHLARPESVEGPRAHAAHAHQAASRVTPEQEIIKQYKQFVTNFEAAGTAYTQALSEQSTGTVSVTTTLTADYTAGYAQMQVANTGVFGPSGIFTSPVIATAQVGSVPVGQFTLIGSSGNLLAIDISKSTAVSLQTGTNLTAQVPSSAATSAGSIFPNYITTSTQQLAINLVAYFNNLPIRLPRMYALPHQDQRGGAIQQYIYQVVDGNASTSLKNTLIAIALPQTPGGDLQIYDAAVEAAVEGSETQMISDVKQIFAGKFPVVPTNTSSSSTTTAGTSSSSTSGTGSSSTTSGTGGSTAA